MKSLYAVFAVASLMLLAPSARANDPSSDNPTETARKATTRDKAASTGKFAKAHKKSSHRLQKLRAGFSHAVLVLVGLEESKAVTSPAKLNRQLHIHQRHLRAKARMDAKARRRRDHHLYS